MTKAKGQEFEEETASLAGKRGRRIPRSGGYGTVTGIAKLSGDARWDLPWLSSSINLECKHGYSGEPGTGKSMTIKREWFDKHLAQAKAGGFIPMFAMKFKFTTEDGMSKFILIPFSAMKKIIKQMDDTYLELEELREYKRQYSEQKK